MNNETSSPNPRPNLIMNAMAQSLYGEIEQFIKANRYTWTVSEILDEYVKYKRGAYISHTAKHVVKKFIDQLDLVNVKQSLVTPDLNNWLEWLYKRIPALKEEHNKTWLVMAMQGFATECCKRDSGNMAVYDCDYCKNFPCALQEMTGNPNKKLKLNECGDFKPIKCEHENIEQGIYPDKPPICKDCGEEV